MRASSVCRPGAGARFAPGARGRAFTLVELLVVIAILGLLVTMIAPTLRRIGRRAQTGVCASHLVGLQVAVMGHVTGRRFSVSGLDWSWVSDGNWETWWGEKGRENVTRGWVWPYVQQFEMYLCPTFASVVRDPPAGAEARPGVAFGAGYTGWGGTVDPFDPDTFEPVRSYSLNEYIGSRAGSFLKTEPARRVWLADENPWRNLYEYPELNQSFGINNGHLGRSDTPAEYHAGRANAVFGDGHVELVAPPDVLANIRE